ncbi:DUF222 domain-containing protein [Microbacterium sp. NPDC089696]|uniref:HNH endonuclease signature motif containing protein n=1 Tax=Microbacterium sp. NPDC089696 TaxID=3364199 RepID=UPI0037FC1A65
MAAIPEPDLDRRRALLDAWVEKRRRIAVLEAQASSLLAERMTLSQSDAAENPFHRDAIHRSMIAEYAAAGRLSTGAVEYAFTDAAFLHRSHPEVLAAFRAGSITAAHVRAIVREGGIVREAVDNGIAEPGAVSVFDSGAVIVAQSESPARTAVHVRALAAVLAGVTVNERHARARSERAVTMRSVDDGLALLTVVLPEHLAVAIMDRLTRLARGVVAARVSEPARDDRAIFGDGTFTTDPLIDTAADPETRLAVDGVTDPVETPEIEAPEVETPDGARLPDGARIPPDDRTIDQVRADLLTDLLLAVDPSAAHGQALDGIQARIQVTVAATTLAGLDDRPAEIDGVGPLHPDIARALAGRNSGWSRLFLDARGLVTETDTYTPTEPMRRFLRARDQHCRFPGCRMPVHRCQVDHTHDHAKGGRTEVHNLGHLCATHHVLKHPDIADDHRWSARQLPDGTIDWLSPLGRSYRDVPRPRVMFT